MQTFDDITLAVTCVDCGQRLQFKIGLRANPLNVFGLPAGQLQVFIKPHDCATSEEIFKVTLVPIDDDQAPGGSSETTVHDEEKGTFGDEIKVLFPLNYRETRAWELFLFVLDGTDAIIH